LGRNVRGLTKKRKQRIQFGEGSGEIWAPFASEREKHWFQIKPGNQRTGEEIIGRRDDIRF